MNVKSLGFVCALGLSLVSGASAQVYTVDQIKVVSGNPSLSIKNGMVYPQRDQELAWKIPAAISGNYYLTLEVQSGTVHGEEYIQDIIPLLHEGKPVAFSSSTGVQKSSGNFKCEITTDHTIPLQPGDELRISPGSTARGQGIGTLTLKKEPSIQGPTILATNPTDPDLSDSLRVTAQWQTPSQGNTAQLTLNLTNVRGQDGRYEVRYRVLDYFQVPLADKQLSLEIKSHLSTGLDIAFPKVISDRYRCVWDIKDEKGNTQHGESEILVDWNDGARGKQWFNEGWEMLPATGVELTDRPPDSDKWIPKTLPATNGANLNANIVWWRKTFTPNSAFKGERVVMHFTRIHYEATVYLNGKKLAYHLGPNQPLEVDLTKELLWDKPNEILVQTRNGVAVLTENELKKPKVEVSDYSEVLGPGGEKQVGFWETYLYKEPTAHLSDIFVKTSFRQHRVNVEVEATGLNAGEYSLTAQVEFEGKPVLSLPEVKATADNGHLRTTLSQPWKDPILWGLKQPNLLCLIVKLKDRDGKLLDERRERFGFRELWAENSQLLLNGMPVKFRGFAMEDSWGRETRMKRDNLRQRFQNALQQGGQFQRHGDGPQSGEIADELGLLISYSVSSIYNPTIQKIESDKFWEVAMRDGSATVRANRNHPSICEWYISNEFVECAPRSRVDLAIQRDRKLADAVNAADGTRIVHAGCDLDLRGYLPVISTHYPDLYMLRQSNACLPESRLWRFANETLKPGDHVPMGLTKFVANVPNASPLEWGKKPIMVNENTWVYYTAPPEGLIEIADDAVFKGPGAMDKFFYKAIAVLAEGHRDAEASLITPWLHVYSWRLSDGLPDCAVIPVMPNSGWFEGNKYSYAVNVHHDVLRTEKCRLEWGISFQGTTTKQGEESFELRPAELKRLTTSFQLPKVENVKAGALWFKLYGEDQRILASSEMPGRVWPKAELQLPPQIQVGLYDPRDTSRAALEKAGLKFETLTTLDKRLDKISILIVAKDAGNEATLGNQSQKLQEFVRNGGRVLLLPQSETPSLKWSPVNLQPATEVIRSRGFLRAPHSPLLAGLTDIDLKWWLPDTKISFAPYLKPSSGNVVTVIDLSDGVAGLGYSGLLDIRDGKGRIVACQLAVPDRLEVAPAARQLLQNILVELAKPVEGDGRVAILTKAGGTFDQKLSDAGAAGDRVNADTDLNQYRILLLDGSLALSEPQDKKLSEFVTNGGTIYLHGAGKEQLPRMRRWFGASVTGSSPEVPAWKGRAVRVGADSWLDGLSNQDFFWRRKLEGESMSAYCYSDRFLIEVLQDWVWSIPDSQPLLYPAGLIRVNQGKGSWLIDMIRWDQAGRPLATKAERIRSVLLTNLGVRLKGKAPRQLLKDIEYVPLDLRPVLNRPLTDNKEEDSDGGWTDQGPDKDLRNFTTGAHTFEGVPFEIPEGKSCLVMASRHRKVPNPTQVSIPVNMKANAFYFLQTSAWTSPTQHGNYIIKYDDGTVADIPLVGGENLRDWAAPDLKTAQTPFMNETETLTRWAWSGSCPAQPVVSLFMMQWINPTPQKKVQSIIVQTQKQGVLILLGVTAGVEKKTASIETKITSSADMAKAEASYQEGIKLLNDNKPAEAVTCFEASVKLFAANIPARLRLAQTYLQINQPAKAVAFLTETINTYPKTLESYQILGRYYEEQKNWKEAQTLYQRSIEVDPNQPWIMQALDRVSKQVP